MSPIPAVFSTEYSEEMDEYLYSTDDFRCTCRETLKPLYEKIPADSQDRRCYNYLIFDSKKLLGTDTVTEPPERRGLSMASQAEHEGFKKFVAAVVYVGKGTERGGGMEQQRSHVHIHEAHKSNCKVRSIPQPS